MRVATRAVLSAALASALAACESNGGGLADALDASDAAVTLDAPNPDAFDAASEGPVCAPGARRCDPGTAQQPQVCRADGSGYDDDGPACDVRIGAACRVGRCVDPCAESVSQRSNLGCEYYAVTTANAVDAMFGFAVALANGNDSTVHVRIEGGALGEPVTRDLAAGQTAVIELPWVSALSYNQLSPNGLRSARVDGGAYHIVANGPVSAYQFNPLNYRVGTRLSQSNDASLLLAVPSLTARYRLLTYGSGMLPMAISHVTLVGTSETPTEVTVTPTTDVREGLGITAANAGSTLRYTLRRGDVVELVSSGSTADLTGTLIDATQPVAVFSGNLCAYVPRAYGFCDHLEEQLVPREAWGTRVAVTALRQYDSIESMVRVIADRANTRLTFDPPSAHDPVTLGAGEVLEFMTAADFVLDASAPVLVAQLMHGELNNVPDGHFTSPALVYEIPIAQFRDDSRFFTPDTYTRNFVNIVGTGAAPPLVDGAPITASPRVLGASGLSTWSTELAPGPHRVTGAPGSRFGVKVYGVAPNTSYAYPAALDLAVINPPG